jgi:hypothetical protein
MNDSAAEAILERIERSGKLDGVEIEYYVGGGAPPPYTRNDQLRFHTHEGREVVEFAKSNFKYPEYNPYPLDIYRLPVEPADVCAIVKLIRAGNAFGTHYPEETNPRSADIIRTELVITREGDEATRVYYMHVPAALAPLEKEVEAMIERVKAKGEHGLYAGDKKIPERP